MAKDPFWSNLFRRNSEREDELYEILSRVPIFQDLGRREFERVRHPPSPIL